MSGDLLVRFDEGEWVAGNAGHARSPVQPQDGGKARLLSDSNLRCQIMGHWPPPGMDGAPDADA